MTQLCASCSTVIPSMQSFRWRKINSQTYTTAYLYMQVALVFSVTPQPLSPCQGPSPTWARNRAETEAKASLQIHIRASSSGLSRAPTFFRWRLRLAENSAQMGACVEGASEAYRHRTYPLSDSVPVPGKCSVEGFVSRL